MVKAGEWTERENILSGINTVSIYAVAPGELDALIEHLQDYAPLLPETVQQSGLYTK